MADRMYVSTIEASYFNTRMMGCDVSPPNSGEHRVGDIVISSLQQNDAIGWVCVEAGKPGKWKVICDIINIKNDVIINKNDIKKLADKITKNEGDISELNSELNTFEKTVERDINQLEVLIDQNKNDIDRIDTTVENNSVNISKNVEDINKIKTQLNNAKNVMDSVSEQVDDNSNAIDLIEREIIKLNDNLDDYNDNNDKSLKDIQDKLNDLKQKVGNISDNDNDATGIYKSLDELQKEINNIKKDINNLADVDISELNTSIIEIQKLMDKVEKDINDLNSIDIVGLFKDIEDIQKEIINLKERFDELNIENISELIDSINNTQVLLDTINRSIVDITEEILGLNKSIKDIQKEIESMKESIENNTKEITDMKWGLINSLISKGFGADETLSWKELFDILLSRLNTPEEPTPEPEPEEPTPEEIPCTSIRFTESSLKIHIDQVTDLKEILVIQPDGCTDLVEWIADNTVLEINNGVIKGLAEGSTKVQARCGDLSANINITVVTKITEDLGEGLLLYKAGTEYNTTEFRNLCKTDSLLEDALCYELNVSKPHVWFSYDGFVNFSNYDRVEITAYTEKSTQQPVLGLSTTSKSGQCGYDDSPEWEGSTHTDLTLMYNVTETKYSLPINYTGSGYLLLWMNHANSALGRVYITEIRVIPKKTENDDPIEIIDDEITIQVGEKYDATKLYTLQKGYNVQYKYTSIIAIEGEHTIVGKEVGTTELEIICGGIVKIVTVNVIGEQTPIEPK